MKEPLQDAVSDFEEVVTTSPAHQGGGTWEEVHSTAATILDWAFKISVVVLLLTLITLTVALSTSRSIRVLGDFGRTIDDLHHTWAQPYDRWRDVTQRMDLDQLGNGTSNTSMVTIFTAGM